MTSPAFKEALFQVAQVKGKPQSLCKSVRWIPKNHLGILAEGGALMYSGAGQCKQAASVIHHHRLTRQRLL